MNTLPPIPPNPASTSKHGFRRFYRASVQVPSIIDLPVMNYIMVDGSGEPRASLQYREAIAALRGVAKALRVRAKRITGKTFAELPLEGLWWFSDGHDHAPRHSRDIKWTLMIMQPPLINAAMFDQVAEEFQDRHAFAALSEMRFQAVDEGRCVQLMHEGAYATERTTLDRLYEFMRERDMKFNGPHHEIYLTDPATTPQADLRTIVRQPVRMLVAITV